MNRVKEVLGTYVAPYNKALVPVVVAGALSVLARFDVLGDMTVEETLTLLATAGLVWLVPNKKA